MRNQLSKTASIIVSPQAIIHQLSADSASSTSIIVSVQIASKSTQTVVLNLFYIERLFTDLFLIHFQTKDSDTHAYAHSWSSHDGARNQPNNQLLTPFLLQHVFVFVNKPIYRRNFFVLASFLQAGEGNQQNNQPSSPFLL